MLFFGYYIPIHMEKGIKPQKWLLEVLFFGLDSFCCFFFGGEMDTEGRFWIWKCFVMKISELESGKRH